MEKVCIVFRLGPYMTAIVICVLSLSTQVGAITPDMGEPTKKLESLLCLDISQKSFPQ